MRRREWILLAAYCALIVILSFYHEMWRDEVRAWTVATEAPSWGGMFAELHHEGHPALWYMVLRAGYLLTHSRLVLPIAAIVIAVAAAWLILRFSPFPSWLNALALFGAFLGYELSVSARNYGIGVLLMIVACTLYPARGRKPVGFAIALALLANTSVHAAIASALMLGLWLIDSVRRRDDEPILQSVFAAAIVIVGIIVALVSARPTADMAWAGSLASLSAQKVLQSVLTDPGNGLMGFMNANIAGVSEYPWRLTRINPVLASRVIVDGCLLWLFWNLRTSMKAILAVILAIFAFEIVFRSVYTGSLRHEGFLLFLILSVCWVVVVSERGTGRQFLAGKIAVGLAPLFVLQALALPVLVNRTVAHDESSSRRFARFIRTNPRYANAILMGEPDYLMESMPYYVSNRIYMARQKEYAHRVYFDVGVRRQQEMTLSELQETAAKLTCRFGSPVLVAIGARAFSVRQQGSAPAAYHARFAWTTEEHRRFRAQFRRVAEFPQATGDEVYEIFESPPCRGASSM